MNYIKDVDIPKTMYTNMVMSPTKGLKINGRTLTVEEGKTWRQVLRVMLDDGEIDTIEFDAIVFNQGENANDFVFMDEDLDHFALSFTNQPFLRNHDQRDIGSRDGIVQRSSNVSGAFMQHINITTERGIKSFIEGQIDRFSIGFDSDRMLCSICRLDYFGGSCPHLAGRVYEDLVAQLVFINPVGVETSAVNVPAVSGTRVLNNLKRQLLDKHKLEDQGMPKDEEDVITEAGDDTEINELNEAQLKAEELRGKLAALAGNLMPFILTALFENPEAQEALAKALHLDDMDRRIGEAELALNSTGAKIKEILTQVSEMGSISPGSLLELTDDDLGFNPWNGYTGSKAGTASATNDDDEPEDTDVPPPSIRKAAVKAKAMSNGSKSPESNGKSLNDDNKDGGKMNSRQTRGAVVGGYWNEGG